MKSENASELARVISDDKHFDRQGKQGRDRLERFLPPPKLSVAEWAGQERVLSSESSAQVGNGEPSLHRTCRPDGCHQ